MKGVGVLPKFKSDLLLLWEAVVLSLERLLHRHLACLPVPCLLWPEAKHELIFLRASYSPPLAGKGIAPMICACQHWAIFAHAHDTLTIPVYRAGYSIQRPHQRVLQHCWDPRPRWWMRVSRNMFVEQNFQTRWPCQQPETLSHRCAWHTCNLFHSALDAFNRITSCKLSKCL